MPCIAPTSHLRFSGVSQHVEDAMEQGAVESLLLSDSLFRSTDRSTTTVHMWDAATTVPLKEIGQRRPHTGNHMHASSFGVVIAETQ